jgi:sigma-B regulation protein RsbU (phosphoserine phosphatase)
VTIPGTGTVRDQPSLFRTLPGRLFLLSSAILLTLLIVRQFVELPAIGTVFRSVARLAWIVSAIWLSVLGIARHSSRFLWRVRQKLILSYIFLGFVPVLLVVALALVGGLVLYFNVAAYIFNEGFADIADSVQQTAETAAVEIGRAPTTAAPALQRKYGTMAARYAALSLAVLPAETGLAPPDGQGLTPVSAGPWRHMPAPRHVPIWLRGAAGGFRGIVAVQRPGSNAEWLLVARSAVPTPDGSQFVIVDLPMDADMVAAIEARTKTRMGPASVPEQCGGPAQAPGNPAATGGMLSLFRQTVAFMDCRDWMTGTPGRLSVSLDAPVSRLYGHVRAASPVAEGGVDIFLGVLVMLGVFFLVIQGAALFFGALLARSITYAVHELFAGTERVQQGDFTHRIRIDSGDQLGELAASFNRMSASIDHLLHVQREKQRLDDELRIAREIQKSLLPTSPPVLDGVSIADLCEPAREVGGDYYDFFDLGPRQIGVMIADVSGKGTSAALYMAELKGLMLSLSHRERSPRQLMIEANRLLSAHLDNRSFITMTYMVIDLDAWTLTCARAGHTPLLVVSSGEAEVVTPAGMVLGLRLPGATERFSEVLEEHTRRVRPGDVFVLYTDGITEAMDRDGELFSDAGLARVVTSHARMDAVGIRERVVREVRAFVGEAEPHDDMTMIVVKIDEEMAA